METKQETLLIPMDGPERMELKPERVQQMLEKLPGWELHPSGRAILRTRLFTTDEGARAFARNICWLAGKLRQPVTVRLAGKEVAIALTGHPVRGCVGGLTGPVFKLADLIG